MLPEKSKTTNTNSVSNSINVHVNLSEFSSVEIQQNIGREITVNINSNGIQVSHKEGNTFKFRGIK